jgi:hypothetical protein
LLQRREILLKEKEVKKNGKWFLLNFIKDK